MLIAWLNKLESERRLQRADSFFMTPRLLSERRYFWLANDVTQGNIWGTTAARTWMHGASATTEWKTNTWIIS